MEETKMPKKEDNPFIKKYVPWRGEEWMKEWKKEPMAAVKIGRLLLKAGIYQQEDKRGQTVTMTINGKNGVAIAGDLHKGATGIVLQWVDVMRSFNALDWFREAQELELKEAERDLTVILDTVEKRKKAKRVKILTASDIQALRGAVKIAFNNIKMGAAYNAVIVQCKKDLKIEELEIVKQTPETWPHLFKLMNTAAGLIMEYDQAHGPSLLTKEYRLPLTLEDITPGPLPEMWGRGYCLAENYKHTTLTNHALIMARGELFI